MGRRRLGTAGARALAASASLTEAIELLARSPYGHRTRPGSDLAGAQRGVAEALLWNLRVLAGWLPAAGAELLRLLAGWFEIANVDEHLQVLSGQPAEPPYRLGTLATAWPRLAAAGSADQLRAALAASPWGEPGGTGVRDIQLAMRLVWAERVAARAPAARAWAAGGAALLVARERYARDLRLPAGGEAAAGRLLGRPALAAGSLAELAAAVPPVARWAVAGVPDPAGLWTAETRWWRRLRTDGARLLAGSGFGPERVVGAVGMLAADAWLVRGALEAAARGGPDTADRHGPPATPAMEVFDALA
jgi:hypothetical protein